VILRNAAAAAELNRELLLEILALPVMKIIIIELPD